MVESVVNILSILHITLHRFYDPIDGEKHLMPKGRYITNYTHVIWCPIIVYTFFFTLKYCVIFSNIRTSNNKSVPYIGSNICHIPKFWILRTSMVHSW